MNLYQVGPDFIAAKNMRDAVREYESIDNGMSRREVLQDIRRLSEAEMERYTFIDDVYNPDESTNRSFKEQLEQMIARGEHFPTMFASSEY